MPIVLTFLALLVLALAVSIVDWRRGWLFALLVGVLQDPVRKVTPGTPVVLTYSIVLVYFAVLLGGQIALQRALRDFTRRFAYIYVALALLLFFLALGAVNGLFTFGLALWKVPALSLFIYLSPLPAVIVGYAYLRKEEDLYNLLRFYAVITSIALLGTPLEFMKVQWRSLGMVALPEGYIRHLPGIQIRILSGFYRAPDIMAWHASMLTAIGIMMAMRARTLQRAWPWFLVSGWGFLNCIISGRRKAVYMVFVFALFFVIRYVRRLTLTQLISFCFIGATLAGVTYHLAHRSEESSAYTRGTYTTQEEVLQRLEGGLGTTIEQFGILGAGLGTATQGVRHLLGHDENIGWQEGGLGKLAVELGIPGLIAALFFGYRAFKTMWRLGGFPDELDSSQLTRAALAAIAIANLAEFAASAQAYTDAVLTLFTAFLVGCLYATAALEDRRKNEIAAAAPESSTVAPAMA
jgi:hypothetical protein